MKQQAGSGVTQSWGRGWRRGTSRRESLRAHVCQFDSVIACSHPRLDDRRRLSEKFALMEGNKRLKSPETLDDVIKGLYVLFEDDYVNVEEVISFLSSYRSNPADWAKYANYDPHRLL